MKNNVETIQIPVNEYNLLKEIYKTYKRQKFLLRLDETEKNLKKGKVKKVNIDEFIENIK